MENKEPLDFEETGKSKLLSGKDCQREFVELFPSIYLTMMSVIQGVSLSFLMYFSFEAWKIAQKKSGTYVFVLYALLTLLIIATIWHEYLISITTARPANWKDTIYPIFLGVSQVITSSYIQYPSIWRATSIAIVVFGCLAYKNTRKGINCECKKYSEKISHYITVSIQQKEVSLLLAALFIVIVSTIGIVFPVSNTEIISNISLLDLFFFLVIVSFLLNTLRISDWYYKELGKVDNGFRVENRKLKYDLMNRPVSWLVKKFY